MILIRMARNKEMSEVERILPVSMMIVIATMWINGVTVAGVAFVASIVGFYYLRFMAGQKK